MSIKPNSFSIIHLNIRSISRNLNAFETYLKNLAHKFTVLGLTETWLNNSNFNTFCLAGYYHVYNYRSIRVGGGVSLFIQDCFEYVKRNDLCIMNEFIETVFIELNKDQTNFGKNIIIGVVYRPPDKDMKELLDYMNEILSLLRPERKLIYILGDFNINLLNNETHQLTAEFLEVMYSYTLYPLINKPTRVTTNTATLIDNIFHNNLISNETVYVLLISQIISLYLQLISMSMRPQNHLDVNLQEILIIKPYNILVKVLVKLIGSQSSPVLTVKLPIQNFIIDLLNALMHVFL